MKRLSFTAKLYDRNKALIHSWPPGQNPTREEALKIVTKIIEQENVPCLSAKQG